MELRDYLDILRRRWVSGTIVALVVIAAACALTLTTTPKYTSTTRIFFAVQGTDSATELAQGSTFTEQQMSSYAQVATTPLVLDPVIKKLGLRTSADTLARSISAVAPSDTVILELSVTDPDAQQATQIANAVATELASVSSKLSSKRNNGADAVKATILAPAQVPTAPSSPNVTRNIGIGVVLGLVIGLGVALARNAVDTKIRSVQDIERLTDSPVLGTIAFDDKVPQHPMVVADEPLSAPSEAIRRLRTNLQFVDTTKDSKIIVITSSVPGEGKSTTSMNLAAALATAGSRVLLIDADLRRPSIAAYMGMEGRAGLTSLLIGHADASDVIQPWRDTTLHILPSGRIPPNPSELLGSERMQELLDELSLRYDTILIDSPPMLPVTDATVLTRIADGAVIVVGAGRTHRGQLGESLATLETAGAKLFGLVLNKIARRDAMPYVYENGYYSPEWDRTDASLAEAENLDLATTARRASRLAKQG